MCTTPENDALYTELHQEIMTIAKELWGDQEIPRLAPALSEDRGSISRSRSDERATTTTPVLLTEGEAGLPESVPRSERGARFRGEALRGCPRAQHSYGLLLWSGFAGIERDPEESARFHAAAACQNHLDGMAVLGGCLRTGAGIPKRKKRRKKKKTKKGATKAAAMTEPRRATNTVALGLKLIDFCASVGNPTGVNKRAALLESNGDDSRAVELYEACLEDGRANALVRFNLGWCLVHGRGVERGDRDRGMSLWVQAAELAPDEGSEEAAWNLYRECDPDRPEEARRWRDLAEELGYTE